jgi:Tfp pilus assembly protein PilX
MIALIVLVAMTLAGLALIRSMDTTNLIAGNMAFQQAATHSGDGGIETAIAWLEANNSGTTLHQPITAQGYNAARQDPAANQSWDTFWTILLAASPSPVVTLAADASGNTVSYTIHRLCNSAGDPVAVGVDCAVPQSSGTTAGSSKGSGVVALQYNAQVYYRITARVAGPRNTVSFIQAVVAL